MGSWGTGAFESDAALDFEYVYERDGKTKEKQYEILHNIIFGHKSEVEEIRVAARFVKEDFPEDKELIEKAKKELMNIILGMIDSSHEGYWKPEPMEWLRALKDDIYYLCGFIPEPESRGLMETIFEGEARKYEKEEA